MRYTTTAAGRRRTTQPRQGYGYAPCHHGEILQGPARDSSGRTLLALVTLPVVETGAGATFRQVPHSALGEVWVHPRDRVKAQRAAELTVDLCAHLTGQRRCGGELHLTGSVPIGIGMGSSTSDVIASVRAVAASYGVTLAAGTVARLAVIAEGASDPLMLDNRPALFAPREGRVLEILGATLPALAVVGCLTGQGEPVDTLALHDARGGGEGVTWFEVLRAQLRRAVGTGDVALLGRVSTESARHNQALLPKQELTLLEEIAADTGAAGVQVAHSGNVAGLLFDPRTPHLIARLRDCVHALTTSGVPVSRVFAADARSVPAAPADVGAGLSCRAGGGKNRPASTCLLPSTR